MSARYPTDDILPHASTVIGEEHVLIPAVHVFRPPSHGHHGGVGRADSKESGCAVGDGSNNWDGVVVKERDPMEGISKFGREGGRRQGTVGRSDNHMSVVHCCQNNFLDLLSH